MSAGLSVVVPAYDEGAHLADNLRRLVRTLETAGRPFEVLVVDDGSRDETARVAAEVAAEDPRVRVLSHTRNLGKGRALATGCAAAREALLVLLDADLEIPPEDILPLVRRMETAGADLGVGSKYHEQASLVWPLYRRALSRFYHAVTALLFRLPLRDTQTGLKVVRRGVAQPLLPLLRCRRFAWDLELVLLAHRAGHRFVTGPVHVRPAARASRVGWRGALQAGWDTLRIFLRDRTAEGRPGRRGRESRRPTRIVVSGDDLGMSASVNEGLLRGLERGGLTSVSVLARAPLMPAAVSALRARVPVADAGLHLDLIGGARAPTFALASLFGGVAAAVGRQIEALRAQGIEPTHVDAHRHAWCLPWVHGPVLRAVRASGVGAVRSLRPLGPIGSAGPVEAIKRLVLLAGATLSAGRERGLGLRAPDGYVDAREAARWLRDGRLPVWVRGRTVEVIGHPALGAPDWPSSEQGGLDRHAEARAVLDPPLARGLGGLGATIVDFRNLSARRSGPDTAGRRARRSSHAD